MAWTVVRRESGDRFRDLLLQLSSADPLERGEAGRAICAMGPDSTPTQTLVRPTPDPLEHSAGRTGPANERNSQ